MTGDYHMHTLFSDGKNTAEEMVLKAIELGLKEIGISDHACTPPFGGCIKNGGEREYVAELKTLKEKYANQIAIFIGTEVDCFSEYNPELYDYVIGSVHFLKTPKGYYAVDYQPEKIKQCIDEVFGGNADGYAQAYFEEVSKIYQKTGANIIGHFDLLTKFEKFGVTFNKDGIYATAAKEAVKLLAGKATFEINTGAMSRGYKLAPYPDNQILAYIKECGGEVVLSSDAHSCAAIAHRFDFAEKVMAEAGFLKAGFTDKAGNYHLQTSI